MTDAQGFADRMNSLPKYVASTTLHAVTWNNSQLIAGEVAAAVAALKRQPGQNILVIGSGTLAQTLMQHGLVDKYRLMVHPVVLASGKRLFGNGVRPATLQLTETTTFHSGVVALSYRPAGKATGQYHGGGAQ